MENNRGNQDPDIMGEELKAMSNVDIVCVISHLLILLDKGNDCKVEDIIKAIEEKDKEENDIKHLLYGLFEKPSPVEQLSERQMKAIEFGLSESYVSETQAKDVGIEKSGLCYLIYLLINRIEDDTTEELVEDIKEE